MRTKFTLEEKTELKNGGGRAIFRPVYGGSTENENFYKWTPGGIIELCTVNEVVISTLKIGKEYYVDFTEAN